MTIKEYIATKLQPLTISDACITDMELESGLSAEDVVDVENVDKVNMSMIGVIEFLLFAPRLSNINESGFSESWDYSDLGKLYLWLCRKYGRTPNDDATELLGLSMIKDITNIW